MLGVPAAAFESHVFVTPGLPPLSFMAIVPSGPAQFAGAPVSAIAAAIHDASEPGTFTLVPVVAPPPLAPPVTAAAADEIAAPAVSDQPFAVDCTRAAMEAAAALSAGGSPESPAANCSDAACGKTISPPAIAISSGPRSPTQASPSAA